MLRNKVRKIMYGAIVVMLVLMSLKKVRHVIDSEFLMEEVEDVHTSLV